MDRIKTSEGDWTFWKCCKAREARFRWFGQVQRTETEYIGGKMLLRWSIGVLLEDQRGNVMDVVKEEHDWLWLHKKGAAKRRKKEVMYVEAQLYPK